MAAAKDRAADLRLQRTYGITLAEYNQKLKEQGNGCAICGRPPKNIRLSVDHNHAIARTKIVTKRHELGWEAKTSIDGHVHSYACANKARAIHTIRLWLTRKSVRGLLCMICNRKVLGAMERFKVKPHNVIKYLQKYDASNPLLANSKPGV